MPIRRLCTPAMLLLAVAPLMATTTNLIGIIERVTSKESKRGDKNLTSYEVQLRNLWGFTRYPGADDGAHISLKLKNNGIFFLDGKPSTLQEAIKPGHFLKYQGDTEYYACYSNDFRFKEEVAESLGTDRGVYCLQLPDAASATYDNTGKPGKNAKVETQKIRADLFIHLLCRDGAIIVAAASQDPPKDSLRVFSLPIDTSGLDIKDGRLVGSVKVTLISQGRYLLQTESGMDVRTIAIDAPLGNENAEGTYHLADAPHPLTITGRGEPVLDAQRAIVIYTSPGLGGEPDPRDANVGFSVDVRLDGEALERYYLTTTAKGYQSHDRLTRCEWQWHDGHFTGIMTFESSDEHRALAGTVHVDGVRIGDQLFGTYRSDTDDSHSAGAGRFRGMILRPEAPPIIGWDEGNAKRWVAAHKGGDTPMPEPFADQGR